MDLIGKPFLTFEITVKALTLAFRGRLNRPNDFVSQTAVKANAQPVELSPDVVVKAFFTHAPEHVRTLRARFEQVEGAGDQQRQEHLVDLYLAVHSFGAEAELAKFHPVVQLSSAVEARLKKLIEDSQNTRVSNLEIIGDAMDLLEQIFASEPGAGLKSEPAIEIVNSGDELQSLVLALRSRLKPDKQEVAEMPAAVPVVDLVATGK
jgi:chemotaxis protein histidine kinase CheA